MNDLKSCPFCGSEVTFTHFVTPMNMFYCKNCNCGAVVSFNNPLANISDNAKVKARNRRASDERPD